MKARWMVLGALCLPLFLGCSTVAANVINVPAPGGSTTLEIANESLQDDVSIVSAKSFYVDDLMEIVVTLRSNEDENINLEHFFEYYDRDGVVMDDTRSLWTPFTIPAAATKQYKGIAPRAGAVSARFMVRRPLEQ